MLNLLDRGGSTDHAGHSTERRHGSMGTNRSAFTNRLYILPRKAHNRRTARQEPPDCCNDS